MTKTFGKHATSLPDFTITAEGSITSEFLSRNILTFFEALDFIRQMPYGRNPNKDDLTSVFSDGCGTCSTKHAVLKCLLDEHQLHEFKLMVGIFKMNGANTPKVADTLRKNMLEFIPEAHCYIRYQNEIIDVTNPRSTPAGFVNELLQEMEISANQISEYKVNFHKRFLEEWLLQNRIPLALDEIWKIREECISNLFE